MAQSRLRLRCNAWASLKNVRWGLIKRRLVYLEEAGPKKKRREWETNKERRSYRKPRPASEILILPTNLTELFITGEWKLIEYFECEVVFILTKAIISAASQLVNALSPMFNLSPVKLVSLLPMVNFRFDSPHPQSFFCG